MKVYIAKPNTYFQEGSVVELVEYLHIDNDGVRYGLFKGYKLRKGNMICEAEVCSYNDFNIIEQ